MVPGLDAGAGDLTQTLKSAQQALSLLRRRPCPGLLRSWLDARKPLKSSQQCDVKGLDYFKESAHGHAQSGWEQMNLGRQVWRR